MKATSFKFYLIFGATLMNSFENLSHLLKNYIVKTFSKAVKKHLKIKLGTD